MDNTLYTNPEYGQYQIDSLVNKLGELNGFSFGEMKNKVEETRKDWKLSHNGKDLSLSNILTGYGVSMEQNVIWREEIYEPERFLKADKKLVETLKQLSRHFLLGIVTNNPVFVARRTLKALGIENSFSIIVGLDTCMVSKPHKKPFQEFLSLASCECENCVSIGDRYGIDLDIPLEMGMGGILVDGVEDVYELPSVMGDNSQTVR